MESNTSKSKKLLEQALRLLPRDFALSNARAYLNRAISEVASVEIKRENRDRNQKKLQENLQKEKEKFKQDYSYDVIQSLPAERRLAALRPVNVDEGVTTGMKYFMSKGWTDRKSTRLNSSHT